MSEEVRSRFSTRVQLHDGRLTVLLEPVPGGVAAGVALECRLALQDPAMPEPLEVSLPIRVTDDEKPEPKPKPKTPAPKGGDGAGVRGGKGKPAPTHGLPP